MQERGRLNEKKSKNHNSYDYFFNSILFNIRYKRVYLRDKRTDRRKSERYKTRYKTKYNELKRK